VSEISKPELNKIDITDFRPPEETYQFLSYDENLRSVYPSDWPLFKVFQGETYGFAVSRSGFGRDDNGLVLCANGGTNGTNHHQLDIGQVIMTFNRHNFIFDPGYGRAFYLDNGEKINHQNYFAKSSMGHNIVTIDGTNQIDSSDAHGLMRNCVTNDEMDFFEIEMASAYENCSSAVRTVKRRRNSNIVEIKDSFNLNNELPVRLAWFYKGDAEILSDGYIKITSPQGTCLILIESNVSKDISLQSYSEKGYMDRNNEPLRPETYQYISINIHPGKMHRIKTIFRFRDTTD
jgi:hypothetical protein